MKKTLSLLLVVIITIPVLCYIIVMERSAQSVSTVNTVSENELSNEFQAIVPKPEVSAASCVLIDAKNGDILYGKSENKRLPMASTTKVMTAILAIEKLDLNSQVKIRFEDINIEGSNIYIKTDDNLTVKDLLYGLLLESGNDCANVLAYNAAGGKEEFAKLMNQKAKELGLENTNFENPSGLDGKNHYTTSEDLAKIMMYAMKNPIFREITACEKMTLSDGKFTKNHNKLLKMTDYCTGGKTGFTKKSGRCLVSSASRNGMEYIAVTLNAPSDWDDHIKLYEYAFSNFYPVILCSGESIIADVAGGIDTTVEVINSRDITVRNSEVKNGYEKRIILPKFLYAPLNKGDIVGKIEFYNKEKVIDSCELIVSKDVVKEKDSLWNKIKRGFFN